MKNTKVRKLVTGILFSVLMVFSCSLTKAKEEKSPQQAISITNKSEALNVEDKNDVNKNSQTVYITKSGKRYHKQGCSCLKKSKKEIDVKTAEKAGYTPCSRCFKKNS